MHGSPPPELLLGTGVNVTCEEGNGGKVLVAAGVSVNVAVGGGGVAVGMADWVSASIVKATAAIVLCMLTALTVGVACAPRAPQALTISAVMSIGVTLEKHFM